MPDNAMPCLAAMTDWAKMDASLHAQCLQEWLRLRKDGAHCAIQYSI